MAATINAQVARYELEVELAAPPERAWRAITEETHAWWPADCRATDPASRMTLDPTAGGTLAETAPDGTTILWYTVQMVRPGKTLYLCGYTFPEWGGPFTSMLTLTLEADGKGSVLRIQDALVGNVDESRLDEYVAGWTAIFGKGLAPHLARAAG